MIFGVAALDPAVTSSRISNVTPLRVVDEVEATNVFFTSPDVILPDRVVNDPPSVATATWIVSLATRAVSQTTVILVIALTSPRYPKSKRPESRVDAVVEKASRSMRWIVSLEFDRNTSFP